jgi:hypothetical protein
VKPLEWAAARTKAARGADVTASKSFALLVRCQLRPVSKPYPSSLRPLAPLASPGADELTLELRKSPEDYQHRPPIGGRRISPGIVQRPEPSPLLGDFVEDGEEIACRAGQAVEPGDEEHVIRPEGSDRPLKLRAVSPAPNTFSLKIFWAPAALNWATWASRACPSVETRA